MDVDTYTPTTYVLHSLTKNLGKETIVFLMSILITLTLVYMSSRHGKSS